MKSIRKVLGAAAVSALLLGSGAAHAQLSNTVPVFKSFVDNGNFNTAQRGTTTVTGISNAATYLWDRWAGWTNNASGSVSLVNITSGLPAGFTNGFQLQRASNNAQLTQVCLGQEIPSADVIGQQGQPMALSAYLAAGSNFSAASSQVTLQMIFGTGTDEGLAKALGGIMTGQTNVTSNQVITTTMTRYGMTVTEPANATEAVASICFTPVGTAGSADYIQGTGIQLEQGTTVTQFEWRSKPLELASKLLYYFQVITDNGTAATAYPSSGVATATTVAKINVAIPTMRTAPTVTVSAATSFSGILSSGQADPCTSLVKVGTPTTGAFDLSCAVSGSSPTFTAGNGSGLGGAGTNGTIQLFADY